MRVFLRLLYTGHVDACDWVEEQKEIHSGNGSNSKELCWIFILHAVNVILGVAAFAFLHETSTELVTAEMKVKNESKIDPPTTMPIIISSLLS